MKISIGSKIVQGPWGGGNLFAINLKNFLIKNGHQVVHNLDDDDVEKAGYKKVKESKFKKMATASFLNEISYKEFKKNPDLTAKQKVNQSIKEVSSKLFKIERIISQNIKLKTEEGIDGKQYWKSTRKNLYKISERMMRIGEKLRKF